MPETANKEVYQPLTFDAIKIGLASTGKNPGMVSR